MRYTIPTRYSTAQAAADYVVWYAFCALFSRPITAILSGTLWGPEAFVGGAAIVSSIIFISDFFDPKVHDAV